ncbi:hypothetical protein EVJ58_g818 [Rhodofomes roseus]|uniref:Transmembrane protein n=1 Tax=Rhodofomes roseus TaxID=34475 RepID=A0A4Y9Z1P7_9APHY|nr:hypothetical protein EVJ58_g818 [Rhodofomes roseus]
MAIAFSLVFIFSLSCAFIGSEEDEPPFKELLDSVAANNPGIVLIGDNVDVDVDEPAMTIRWSIIGCGSAFVLPGSEGTHGSNACGLPSMALNVYVDSGTDPEATYDPTQFPTAIKTGQRISIQNLCQFDSDHVLDVHLARMYPFDTYQLASTLRVTDSDNNPVSISAMTTLKLTSSFAITPTEVDSHMNTSNGVTGPSSDIILYIRRPPEARLFAMLLFCVTWMLAHAAMIVVVLARLQGDSERTLQYMLFILVVLLAIPQLRNTMPDAPGFDGVLLDSIGFFPQMICAALAGLLLFISIAHRILKEVHAQEEEAEEKARAEALPQPKGLERLRRQGSSIDFRGARRWSRAAFPGVHVQDEVDGF